MDSDNLDLDFLIQGKKRTARHKPSELEPANAPEIYDLPEHVDATELLDLSLLLSNKLPRIPESNIPIDLTDESEREPGSADLLFDINEEVLRVVEEVQTLPEEADEALPVETDHVNLDEPRLPEVPADDPHESVAAAGVESKELSYDIEAPLILPIEPSPDKHEAESSNPPNETIDGHSSGAKAEKDTFDVDIENEADLFEPWSESPPFDEGATKNQRLRPEDRQETGSPTAPGDITTDSESKKQESDSEIRQQAARAPLVPPQKVELYSSTVTKGSVQPSEEDNNRASSRIPKPQKAGVHKSGFSLTSVFQSKLLVGLDIGATSLKYIILKKSVRGLALLNCGISPLPPVASNTNGHDRTATIAEALLKHLNVHLSKNTNITSAVSGLEVIYQNIQVPAKARRELKKAVPWACQKDFPFPMESTTFEYHVIDNGAKNRDKLDVFVVAAQKKLVWNHLEILEQAGIVPAKISTVPSALLNLCKLREKNSKKCYAVIDIGGTSSHIVFINHGELQFARQIPTAGNDFTEALIGSIFVDGKEINIKRARAEKIKRKYGFLEKSQSNKTEEGIPLKEVSVMMGPVLERMAKEIERTIDFFKEKSGIDSLEKIYLTGGGSHLKLLSSHLNRELDCQVDTLDPFEFISTKNVANQTELENIAHRFAVAAGLALDREKELNLLPEGLRGQHKVQYAKRIFRHASILLILLMILLSTNVKKQVRQIEDEFSRINAEYMAAKPKRQRFLALQKKLTNLQKIQATYERRLNYHHDAPSHLKAISHLIPTHIALTSFRILRRSVQDENKNQDVTEVVLKLDGVAFQDNSMEGINLAKFLLALENANYFYEISLKRQRITEKGNLEFSIECVI